MSCFTQLYFGDQVKPSVLTDTSSTDYPAHYMCPNTFESVLMLALHLRSSFSTFHHQDFLVFRRRTLRL